MNTKPSEPRIMHTLILVEWGTNGGQGTTGFQYCILFLGLSNSFFNIEFALHVGLNINNLGC